MVHLRVAVLLAASAVACTAPDASAATITSSQITSPADGAVVGPVTDSGLGTPFTVTGTTQPASVNQIRLVCYHVDVNGVESADTVESGFATNADGTFSTDNADASAVSSRPCLLRAIPDAAAPLGGAALAFQPVRITAITQSDSTDGGKTYDYYDTISTPRADAVLESLGACGINTLAPFAPSSGSDDQQASTWTFYCNGYYPPNLQPYDSNYRAAVQIGGQDAFFAYDARSIRVGDPWPGLTVSRTYDPATGVYTSTEDDTLSRCPGPNDTAVPTDSTNCSALSATDVTVHRVMRVTHQGLVIEQTDTWKTTGDAEAIDLLDDQQFPGNSNLNGYEFPGQSALATHNTAHEVVTIADPGRPATMLYSTDTTKADGVKNPQASIALFPVPDKAVFLDSSDINFAFHYAFTIPAGGSYTIRKVYATELTSGALAPLTSFAADMLQGPSVAITAPADGATVNASGLTVSGTDADNVGVTSVTVNGQAATLGSGTFSKDITLAEGANTITVVASDAAGNTATATRSVTFTKPPVPPPPPAKPTITKDGTVKCPTDAATGCLVTGTWTTVKAFATARRKRRHTVLAATWTARIRAGHSARATPHLTRAGRALFRTHHKVFARRAISAGAAPSVFVTRSRVVFLFAPKKKH